MTSGDRVLVTGAGGFIGSHLAELLVERGFKTRALIRYNSRGSRGWLEDSPRREDIEFVAGDIRDSDSMSRAVEGCATIFHLAALVSVPYSAVSPVAYLRTNVEGTHNVLRAALDRGAGSVLVVSTSEIYGTARTVPMDEDHPLSAQSPYAASKIAAEQLALACGRTFGLAVKVVRPFNTYGPRQSARAVIPAIAIQALSGPGPIRLGRVRPTRDFVFVRDTAEGFLRVAETDSLAGDVVNICRGEETSVEDLVRLIGRRLGRELRVEEDPLRLRPEASEVMRLRGDGSRLAGRTGWRPACPLERGLDETLDWLQDHLHLYKPGLYNI
jgi:NAD dependent epimerase/dehydratase